MRPVRIALSGTPGTGKSAVGVELRRLGFSVIDLNGFARAHGLLGRLDRARKTREVDIDGLGRLLERELQEGGPVFLEGHVAHLLPVDIAIVLRCSPPVLRRRLAMRKYPPAKIRENSLAEALDAVTTEAVARLGRGRVVEMDTTRRKAASAARDLARLVRRGWRGAARLRPGAINYTNDIIRNAGYYSGCEPEKRPQKG
jgi:adenylate kinase